MKNDKTKTEILVFVCEGVGGQGQEEMEGAYRGDLVQVVAQQCVMVVWGQVMPILQGAGGCAVPHWCSIVGVIKFATETFVALTHLMFETMREGRSGEASDYPVRCSRGVKQEKRPSY